MGCSCFQSCALYASQPCKFDLIAFESSILSMKCWVINLTVNAIYQVVGAFWYLFSIEREYRCWHDHCGSDTNCIKSLYCASDHPHNQTIVDMLKTSCPFTNPDDIKNSSVFNFGIFTDALESGVVETRDFPVKFFYCFWWALRSLRFVIRTL